MKKPKSRIHKKILKLAVAILVLISVSTGITAFVQYRLEQNTKIDDVQKRMNKFPAIFDAANTTATSSLEAYDKINTVKAKSVSYLVNNVDAIRNEPLLLDFILDSLSADNIVLVDRQGNTIYETFKSDIDFTKSRFNQIRTVFTTGEPCEPFFVVGYENSYRFYADKIDDNTEAVIMINVTSYQKELASYNSFDNILKNFSSNSEGFTFAYDTMDEVVQSYPDNEDFVGKDINEIGIDSGVLEEGKIKTVTIGGTRCYAGLITINDGAQAIVCATPVSGNFTSSGFSVLVSALALLASLVIMTFSLVEGAEDTIKNNRNKDTNQCKVTKEELFSQIHAGFIKRRYSMGVVAIVIVFITSFFIQDISLIATVSSYQKDALRSIKSTSESNAELIADAKESASNNTLGKAKIAANVLGTFPAMLNDTDVEQLASALDVTQLSVYNAAGDEIYNNDYMTRTNIAKETDENLVPFAKVGAGVRELVSDILKEDDGSGTYQYGAMIMTDRDSNATGFVLVKSSTSGFDKITANATDTAMYNFIHCSAGGMILAVDGSSKNIVYPTDQSYSGAAVTDTGILDTQTKDGFVGSVDFNNNSYYARTAYIGSNDVMALSDSNYYMSFILIYSCSVAVCMFLSILLLRFVIHKTYVTEFAAVNSADDFYSTDTSAGKPNSKKILTRLMNNSIPWERKTAHQKTVTVLIWITEIYAALFTLIVIFRENIFSENSVIRYVMTDEWQKGFNIFSCTASFLIICILYTVTMLIVRLLVLTEEIMDSKGRTIMRLLISVCKYSSGIITLYYCLALFGIDTKTLLASAGIVGVGISMGSRELAGDILAGLFIIFEGQFQVGDNVQINDWKGTVIDIGVRTTRIMNAAGNVKNFANSNISGLVSLPHQTDTVPVIIEPVSCSVSFTLSLDVSVLALEKVMTEQLPKIKDEIPEIMDGPVYDGITELADNGIKISVTAKCKDKDNAVLQKKLLRAMLILFEENGIELSGQPAQAKPAAVQSTPAVRSRRNDDIF